ncbi:uncharacterized protein LOC123554439 [Mercenaria mercenaria]|uniref:uncharacterized protein LOC123554439 n=1 Tax=Mercenaria mercenaria TaxID=6596 RepID=UPI00234EAB3C|nr:uncharacterized protein LOC123554439 [Mercenaria mercenaria]
MGEVFFVATEVTEASTAVSQRSRLSIGSRKRRSPGPCFACGDSGHIRRCYPKWIQNTFIFNAPKTHCRNNKSSLLEADFVEEAISDLLDRRLIEKCDVQPYIVNPLTVSVQNSDKKRLILDLRNVNSHIWKQSVRFEDIKTALSFLYKGHSMIKFDLTSAYHFIEIFRPHTEYLGFSWTDKSGIQTFYKFLVLPFGLSSACYIFTKITRPLISKWRGEGKSVLMFLDDGYACDKIIEITRNVGNQIKADLLLSGFIPNALKSIWEPVQQLEFLGTVLDSDSGIICIPKRRLDKAFRTISEILLSIKVHRRVTARKLASIVGQLISMSIVTGHVSQIMTRALSIDILKAPYWDSYIALSDESITQLRFWESNLTYLNKRDMFESTKCSKIVFSDASSSGYAGYEVNTINGTSHGMWNEEERLKSSTWRELVAVYRAHKDEIEELPEVLAGKVDLLPELLQKSRAENTCQKYKNSFDRWRKWAYCNGLGRGDILPAKPLSVSLYLCSIIQSANGSSSVIAAFYGIKWFHDLYDLKSPTESKLVQNVLEAGKRILAKPVIKKEPITISILFDLHKRLYEENNAKNQRIICACLIAFAGFLRSSELLNILVSDIVFDKEYMGIFMETSKTDKYRDGAWIVISRTGTALCPVVNVEKLIQWACLKGTDYLFCNLSKVKGGYISRECNKKMSYSNLRDQFKLALTPHVSNIKKYCLHSLRSGGLLLRHKMALKTEYLKGTVVG